MQVLLVRSIYELLVQFLGENFSEVLICIPGSGEDGLCSPVSCITPIPGLSHEEG